MTSHRLISDCRQSLLLLLLAMGLLMSGCSTSGMKPIQTWEGPEAQPDQVAVLKAPSQIKVKKINGRDVGNFLMEDLALNYQLLPGQNTIVFSYETIWAKKTVVENGESKVHKVSSGPQQIVIDAKAGKTYHFEVPELANREEARQFVANSSIPVVSQSGEIVAQATLYKPTPNKLPTLRTAAPADGSATAAPVAAKAEEYSTTNGTTLTALKQLWQKASEDEKREFLRWALK
ncbi:MAG: DUF2057 family protein [Marinobacter sp.]|nr:DUF2057 family protein [Marinobacter sp.]